MTASIVNLLDWSVGKIVSFFGFLDQLYIAPEVSIIAFTVAAGLVAYFVGVLILRA